MGKPERHLWFQEHWNILSNVLFRQAAAQKKCRCSGNLWIVGVVNQRKAKGPRNWCHLFIRHKRFSRLGKLFHTGSNNTTLVTSPNNGNRPTWATGIVITIHKSKWVSFFLKVYHSSLEGVLIIQQSDGSGRYSHNMTSCVNVIICIDSFWSLCAESVNGGTDVVIKGQWTMTTGILIGGISGVRPSKQIKAVIGIRETWSSSGKDKMKLSFFFSHQKMYNGGFF